MSSEYFFFVAEASAISSAPKTMSRGTFFSRASTSTSITSSRLPVTASSQFGYQPCPLDIVERELHRLPFQFHVHAACIHPAQHTDEPAPAGRIRGAHPDFGHLACKTREIRRLA